MVFLSTLMRSSVLLMSWKQFHASRNKLSIRNKTNYLKKKKSLKLFVHSTRISIGWIKYHLPWSFRRRFGLWYSDLFFHIMQKLDDMSSLYMKQSKKWYRLFTSALLDPLITKRLHKFHLHLPSIGKLHRRKRIGKHMIRIFRAVLHHFGSESSDHRYQFI